MKAGDLVRYMSRIILIIDIKDGEWVEGLELGETAVGSYQRHTLKEL
jgi:hypothetical protein